MNLDELAELLANTRSSAKRKLILRSEAVLDPNRLAESIRVFCYSHWTSEPALARNAAAALKTLHNTHPSQFVLANSLWVTGIAELTKGRARRGAALLESAASSFLHLGRRDLSAEVRVAQLMAFAMLGSYDKAIEIGRKALTTFRGLGDTEAVGKIELNLSNIFSRLGRHRDAERMAKAAIRDFASLGAATWRVMAENGLAITYANLNDFRSSERIYRSALAFVRENGMRLTEAEIESSLGSMALMRGNYAEALRELENSRTIYELLLMPHQTAVAEAEVAEAYTCVNLLNEASEIYRRIIPTLRELRLRRDTANALKAYGGVLSRLGDEASAARQFSAAERLFTAEGNYEASISARLAALQSLLNSGKWERAVAGCRELKGQLAKAYPRLRGGTVADPSTVLLAT